MNGSPKQPGNFTGRAFAYMEEMQNEIICQKEAEK